MSTPMPIPDDTATFERHGIRCVGKNAIAETIPFGIRQDRLDSKLHSSRYTDDERLAIQLQLLILSHFLGQSTPDDREVISSVTAAYQRTFREWLAFVEGVYREVDIDTLRQQLAHAWHEIDQLLTDNPR